MKFLTKSFLTAVALLLSSAATAAPYNFSLTYDGSATSLNAGSDNPVGTNLAVGDTFSYQLNAAGNDYWQLNSGGSHFPFLAFLTSDFGTRTANYTLTLLLGGVSQFSTSEAGVTNSYIHIGSNTVNLAGGLQFDQILLNYDLLSSSNSNNRIANVAWPSGVPFSSFQNIVYVDNVSQVPVPGTLALLAIGLLGAGVVRRHKAK